jgi:SAM-dependent MidA family methyltransferase
MTPLERELVAMIAVDGPMPVERYMSVCLSHPEHGYYMSRDPFGRGGDFTTAPEVSQMFGELIGIWCVSTWQVLGAPDPVHVIELGPGRGTLMADLLRAAGIMPGFAEAARVHLVETSPALRAMQEKALAASGYQVDWHGHVADVPAGASVIVGNEFLDALPVRQLQRGAAGWHERQVGMDASGALCIGLGADVLPAGVVPDWAGDAPEGSIVEVAPVRDDYCRAIAARLNSEAGAGLLIDYGHLRHGFGDTLQAVQKHKMVEILHEPGLSDLTSHVDFEAVREVLAGEGCKTCGAITQSQFLAGMGLAERVDMLTKRGDTRQKMRVKQAAQRLVAGNQMGQLFKVLAVTSADVAEPAPFAQMAEALKR